MSKSKSTMGKFAIPIKNIEIFFYAIATILAVVSVGLQSPGQISMDSSIQLYEAKIGESIDWYPPFMSALLRLFGGGETSAFLFICLNTILTYGALLITLIAVLKKSKKTRWSILDRRQHLGLRHIHRWYANIQRAEVSLSGTN